MESVVFRPGDAKNNPQVDTTEMSTSDATGIGLNQLSSLAIPAGTVVRKPRSATVKSFIKTVIIIYVLSVAAGILVLSYGR